MSKLIKDQLQDDQLQDDQLQDDQLQDDQQQDDQLQDDQQQDDQLQDDQQDTFSRDYVEKLRKESGDHRIKANNLALQLHEHRVKALGLLADPRDLPYSTELDSDEAVAAAIETLLAEKPHLKARRAGGNVGQQFGGAGEAEVSLSSLLRRNA